MSRIRANVSSSFIPVTPAGTMVIELESTTKEEAWTKLEEALSHMPYISREEIEDRGYTVIELPYEEVS